MYMYWWLTLSHLSRRISALDMNILILNEFKKNIYNNLHGNAGAWYLFQSFFGPNFSD